MAIEVFNRYENKYIIDSKTFSSLQTKLSCYMEPDAYNKQNEAYTISNIYYDTDDDHLIRTSLAKPKYKEKLRLRAYGTPQPDSRTYIEIKKKYMGLVNKRRSSIILSDAYSFIETGIMPENKPFMNKQVLSEIEYMLSLYELKPRLYLSYERRAYFDTTQHDLRLSFDNNIISRRHDLKLESGIYGDSLLDNDKLVMEIKVSRSIPLWLAHLLSEYKIYPTSFSKYGTEYKHTLKAQPDSGIYSLEPDVPHSRRSILLPAI